MAGYEFRLRVNVASGYRIDCDRNEVTLDRTPDGVELRLKAGVPNTPIKENERLAFLGGPYATEHDARRAANWATTALLRWAVIHRIGIDIGDGYPRSWATPDGLSKLEQEHGVPVRNDLHGVDVYEAARGTKFVHVGLSMDLLKGFDAFRASMVIDWSKQRTLTLKQVTACQIFSSSFFDENPRSRFVSLVTAVEALLEPEQREKAAVLLVAQFRRMVSASDLPKATKDSMRGTLNFLQDESISQTGRKLASRLLGQRTFSGKTPEAFFRACYEIRSNIVHRGFAGEGVNLIEAANELQDFVGELLLASIDAPASVPATASTVPAATHNEIAVAAYALWQARGRTGALDPAVVDWLDAESMLNGGRAS